MGRLMKDLALDRARDPGFAERDKWDEEEMEEDVDTEVGMIDRSESSSLLSLAATTTGLLLCDADRVVGDERYPGDGHGEYIDVTRTRAQTVRGGMGANWPRPT